MHYYKHILFLTFFLFSRIIISDNYDDLKKLLDSKENTEQKKTSIYKLSEKIDKQDAEKIILLCDSLLSSNDKKNVEIREWIKLIKAYCLRKNHNKKGIFELLLSINTGTNKEFKFYVDNILARTYLGVSDYNNALGYFQNNLLYYTDTKPDLKKQVQLLGNISNCYRRMEMSEQALKFALKAIEVAKQTNDSLNFYDANNALAIYYLDTGNYFEADSIYNIMSNYNNGLSKLAKMAFYNNHSEAKLFLNKIKDADILAEKCYQIAIEKRDTFWTAIALANKGAIASKQSNYNLAITLCKTAYEYSKKTKNLLWQKNACECIYENNYKIKNYKDAFDYYQIANSLNDSILSEKNKKETTRKEFQFEYQLKVTADSIKQMEGDKVKDAQIKAQRSQLKQEKIVRISLFVVAFLILVFAIFIYNRFKLTQKQKKIIEKQKEESEQQKLELETKQKEIIDSIRYASRIQKSLLPSEKYISKSISKKH